MGPVLVRTLLETKQVVPEFLQQYMPEGEDCNKWESEGDFGNDFAMDDGGENAGWGADAAGESGNAWGAPAGESSGGGGWGGGTAAGESSGGGGWGAVGDSGAGDSGAGQSGGW